MRKITSISLLLTLLLLPVVVSNGQLPPPRQNRSMIDTLRAAGNFTKLLLLIDKAGLKDRLSSTTQAITLFAPDDNAFQTLRNGAFEEATSDSAKARAVLLPYIMPGLFSSGDLRNAALHHIPIKTLSGQPVTISIDKSQKDSLVLTFVQFTATKPGTTEPINGWPCCGGMRSVDHRTANGFYHEITFTNGGVGR